MLLTHVGMLRRHGLEAEALVDGGPAATGWLDLDVPSRDLADGPRLSGPADLVVVPEVLAGDPRCLALPGRKLLFAQSPFSLLPGLMGRPDYRELGYERAMAVLPTVGRVVETFFGLPATVVPPCIAPYFFADPDRSDRPPRRRRLVVVPQKSPSPDRLVLDTILARFQARPAPSRGGAAAWEVVPLAGLTHRAVARLLQESALLVNTNLGEAFNTTVPEAMAAGCVVLCYEAYCGQEFLRDGDNALVFPNHYVFPLLERLLDLLDHYGERAALLERLRRNAFTTASGFTERATEEALLRFVADLLAS